MQRSVKVILWIGISRGGPTEGDEKRERRKEEYNVPLSYLQCRLVPLSPALPRRNIQIPCQSHGMLHLPTEDFVIVAYLHAAGDARRKEDRMQQRTHEPALQHEREFMWTGAKRRGDMLFAWKRVVIHSQRWTYTPSFFRSFGRAWTKGSSVATSIMAMFIRTISKPSDFQRKTSAARSKVGTSHIEASRYRIRLDHTAAGDSSSAVKSAGSVTSSFRNEISAPGGARSRAMFIISSVPSVARTLAPWLANHLAQSPLPVDMSNARQPGLR